MNKKEMREAFERWIKAPPFEHDCLRRGPNSSWPGQYYRYETEIAWEAWQAALRSSSERNQCDGCVSGAELDGEIHRDKDGKPFMVCQRHRYAGERGRQDGWYCAHCQRGVDSSEVTFNEAHEVCGRIITNDSPPHAVTDLAWLRVIDEELVCAHLGVVAPATDDYDTAKRKLNELICWHVTVATDPATNGGKQLVPVTTWSCTAGCETFYTTDPEVARQWEEDGHPVTAVSAPSITEAELRESAHRTAWRYKKSSDPHHADTYTFTAATLLDLMRKLGIEVKP